MRLYTRKRGSDLLLGIAAWTAVALSAVLAVLLCIRSARYTPAEDTAPAAFTAIDAEGGDAEPPVRERKQYNILVAGVDDVAGLADTIMLAGISADGEIVIMQLPRDTYVEAGGIGRKLNSTYATQGISGLEELLEGALGISIDFTVTVGTGAFRAAVDAIGGIEIDVPSDMDYEDPEQDLYIHIKKGHQVLDGRNAEGFVRYRSGYAGGDLDRLNAQKTFMLAALTALREKTGVSEAVRIATDSLSLVKTDMSAADCAYFVKCVLSNGTGSSGITMLTAPGRALYSETDKTSYYILGREAMLNAVNLYFNLYGTSLPDSAFDPGRIFVKDGDEDFERIYTYSIITPEPVTGGE